jgi:hypothetical protein
MWPSTFDASHGTGWRAGVRRSPRLASRRLLLAPPALARRVPLPGAATAAADSTRSADDAPWDGRWDASFAGGAEPAAEPPTPAAQPDSLVVRRRAAASVGRRARSGRRGEGRAGNADASGVIPPSAVSRRRSLSRAAHWCHQAAPRGPAGAGDWSCRRRRVHGRAALRRPRGPRAPEGERKGSGHPPRPPPRTHRVRPACGRTRSRTLHICGSARTPTSVTARAMVRCWPRWTTRVQTPGAVGRRVAPRPGGERTRFDCRLPRAASRSGATARGSPLVG